MRTKCMHRSIQCGIEPFSQSLWFVSSFVCAILGSWSMVCAGWNLDVLFSMNSEEPAASYRWTGWVWEITGWRSRFRKITDHFRGIYRIYLDSIKENWKVSTCNQLDLATSGSRLIMPKTLPEHWLFSFFVWWVLCFWMALEERTALW